MSASLRFAVCAAVAFALSAAGTASAYHTNFVATRCNYSPPTPITYITKDGSIKLGAPGPVGGIPMGRRLLGRQRP